MSDFVSKSIQENLNKEEGTINKDNEEQKEIIFEKDNDFEILLIKPCDVSNLDWKKEDYLTQILNLGCYENIKMNSKNFSDMISDCLELEKYNQGDLYVNNQLICETPDYLYELFYIDKLKEESITGHITLVKGERSAIANLGNKL